MYSEFTSTVFSLGKQEPIHDHDSSKVSNLLGSKSRTLIDFSSTENSDMARERLFKYSSSQHKIKLINTPSAIERRRSLVYDISIGFRCIVAKNPRFTIDRWSLTWEAIHYLGKDIISCDKRGLLNAYIAGLPVFIFDSYWLFASGHPATLIETILHIQNGFGPCLCVIFEDLEMSLFPSLTGLIEAKLDSVVVITYQSDKTINFHLCMDLISPLNNSFASDLRASLSIRHNQRLSIGTTESSGINPLARINGPVDSQQYFAPQFNVTLPISHEEKIDSRMTVVQEIMKHVNHLFPIDYVVLHYRTPLYRGASHRDGGLPYQHEPFLATLLDSGLGIIIVGVIPETAKVYNPNIVYVSDIGAMPDSFQIHIINGAVACIGNESGMSFIPRTVNTPILFTDISQPFIVAPQSSGCLVLMKRVFKKDAILGPEAYFQYPEEAYFNDSPEMHPLTKDGYILICNHHSILLHSFRELLVRTKHNRLLELLPESHLSVANNRVAEGKNNILTQLRGTWRPDLSYYPITPNLLVDANWHE